MPMIDVYAPAGAFADKHELARRLAAELMAIEEVPDIPMFRKNTAAFIHELPVEAISNVDGDSDYVRVQVLTNAGGLDRNKQIAVVARLTELIAEAPGKPPAPERIWVVLTDALDGGWGLGGHAHTNVDLVAAVRRELTQAVQPATAGKGNNE
jgi:phenylpyruvate tautomerase PptA (4-oxalocrotonate tautomerase family)